MKKYKIIYKKIVKTFKNYLTFILRYLFSSKPKDFKKIPIIINNFNRLEFLEKMINSLESKGYSNIKILDNASTYPPLLEYYNKTPYKVYRYKKNYGSKAFWRSGLWLRYIFNYYVVTDPDLELTKECPDDFLEYFYELLMKYKNSYKVGFALKIDDLPDHFILKNKVIDWEKKFWKEEVESNIFKAPIDTTFALYRPFSKKGKRDGTDFMLRVAGAYTLRHLPWYIESNKISPEEKYYLANTKVGHWSGLINKEIKSS